MKSNPAAKRNAKSCDLGSLPADHCCTIVESISDGVLTIDLAKTITYFNPAAEGLTGFGAREAVGQKCFDVLRSDLCVANCPMDRVLRSGRAEQNFRTSIVDKAGVKKTISVNTALLSGEDGKTIGVVETFRDLTELEQLRRQVAHHYAPEDIVGRNARMREILAFLPDIAESDSPVLIEGPTGSGKELIARAIHSLSSRKNGPFVVVNCAALPDTLLESELFGYHKGAFTGAVRNKPGRFVLAHKGTLFLDEIGSTSAAFQADLLRVLEDGEFTPLGATRPLKADFRIVTATNVGLKKLVQEDRFREDLYYRLNVARIGLPPLSARKEDIPLLVEHFIYKFNLIKNRSIRGADPELLDFLMGYPFPGNIRELENLIEYAFIFCKGEMIGLEHLPQEVCDVAIRKVPPASAVSAAPDCLEAARIRAELEKHGGHRIRTAKALGLSRATLWRKITKYGLE